MSKYTEARKCVERWTFINGNGFTNQDVKDIVCKALEIADRLEQADVEKHSDDWFIRDDNSEFDRGYSIGFEEGYNTALADIRGDKE